ncbi:MAG: FlgD immunoglobulin-like domain containing protein [Calditrichia bacterium]
MKSIRENCIRITFFLFLLVPGFTFAQTANISIQNAQQSSGVFTFEIHIEPTNNWGSGTFDKRLGDCSWAFTFNTSAINSPSLTVVGSSVDPGDGYTNSVQILGSRLIVTTEFDIGDGSGVDINQSTEYHLYTVALNIIADPADSEVQWDQINTGVFNIPDDGIIVGYSGDGDIPLPVSLSAFSATAVDGNINLAWTTQSELNNAGFELYRSLQQEGNYQIISSYLSNSDLIGAGTSNITREYEFTDSNVDVGLTYYYRLADVDLSGIRTFHEPISGSVSEADIVPERFIVHQNYPNPFNPETQIVFELPERENSRVNAVVYDMLGRSVRTLFSGRLEAGVHRLIWNGRDNNEQSLASGTYILQLQTASNTRSVKMLLLK